MTSAPPGAGSSAPADPRQADLGQADPRQADPRQADSLQPDPRPAEPEAPWLRLSPRSLVVRPVMDLIRLLPVLLGLFYLRSRGGSANYWGLAFAAFAIVTSIVRWLTTRYRLTADRIYVRHGLLSKKILSVARDRVRTVDLTAHLPYRVLGLRRVAVGTGRNDRREGESIRLDALTLADAETLRTTLLVTAEKKNRAEISSAPVQSPAPVATEIARLHPAWIRFAPLTLTGMVIIGVVLGFAVQFIEAAHVDLAAIGPVHRLGADFASMPVSRRILTALAGVAAGVVAISTAGYVAVFWKFRLTRHGGGTLRVTRGLLSTRATTIDASRLRGVELSEPLLLRAAGGARLIAITTGLRVGRGAERGGSLLLPPAPSAVARSVTAAVLGEPAQLSGCPLVRHGPRARRRRYIRALAGGAVLVALTTLAVRLSGGPAWVPVSSLVLLPLAAALAADRYASLGHRLTGGWLITRTGSLVRRRAILSTDGIIGWRVHQSWFQRRQGLVTLTAVTAAGRQHYEARDIPAGLALSVASQATPDLVRPFLAAAGN